MAEIRVNATGGLKLFDADDSHYAQIIAGTITSNVDALTLGHASADFNIPVKVLGTTPTLTIGDAGAEDTKIVFDGNAQDFYIALDDSADDLLIGLGSTVGTTPIIAIDENKLSTFSGAVTVGVDDTGHDVKLFGATSGKYWLWDESADGVVAVSNLQQTGTITVGVDDTGHDVKLFGATSGSYALWDESADSLLLTDSTPIKIGDAQDLTLYHDGSNSYITNAVGALKIATETSGIALTIGHTTSETTIADNLTVTGNVGIGETSPLGNLHVKKSDTSASVTDKADTLVVEENTDGGISLLTGTGNTGAIIFGDSGDNDIGKIEYAHGDNSMRFTTNTNEGMRIDSTGAVTKPLQPSFSAYNSGAQSNKTGDDTLYVVLFDTERFDLNGDFASSTFTAPVAGKYLLSAHIGLTGFTTSSTYSNVLLVTSNDTYSEFAGTEVENNQFFSFSLVADMDASDTAVVKCNAGGEGSKVVDVADGGDGNCFFSGCLLA